MGVGRNLATKLLRAVLRHAPADSREWAEAMLRELDYIEGDWAALFWAMGSASAIFRHSGCGLKSWFRKLMRSGKDREEIRMNNLGKKTVGLLFGVGIAAALVVTAFGLLLMTARTFPQLGLERAEWTHILTIVVIPETIFVIAAVMLWRKRLPMAAGILLTGLVLAVHVVVHFAGH
jgi:hypothetical protein